MKSKTNKTNMEMAIILPCVDSERLQHDRKKTHVRKARKYGYFREKRHAQHRQYKQWHSEYHYVNRKAQRELDKAERKLIEYAYGIGINEAAIRPYYITDEDAIRPYYITDEDVAYRKELTEAVLKAQPFCFWAHSDNVDGATSHAQELLDGLSLKELKLIGYISGLKTIPRVDVSVFDTVGYDDEWWPIYGRRLIDPSEFCQTVINEFGLRFAFEDNYYKDCRENKEGA